MPFFRLLILIILLASNNVALSQFRLGASINYSELYFDKEVDALNDIWGASSGFQFHFLYEHAFSKRISVLTGLELIANRYIFNDQSTPGTNDQGEPSGFMFISKMKNTVGVTYLGLPVQVLVYPLKTKSIYLIAGPEVSFKIGYRNSSIQHKMEPDEENEYSMITPYDIPERSRDLMVFASAGLGYRLDSKRLPIDIQIKARHSITTFMADESFIDHWMRSAIVTFSYRLPF